MEKYFKTVFLSIYILVGTKPKMILGTDLGLLSLINGDFLHFGDELLYGYDHNSGKHMDNLHHNFYNNLYHNLYTDLHHKLLPSFDDDHNSAVGIHSHDDGKNDGINLSGHLSLSEHGQLTGIGKFGFGGFDHHGYVGGDGSGGGGGSGGHHGSGVDAGKFGGVLDKFGGLGGVLGGLGLGGATALKGINPLFIVNLGGSRRRRRKNPLMNLFG